MTPLRVLHLTGSPVNREWDDLSRLYATGCLAAVADPARYRHLIAHVGGDGSWRFPRELTRDGLAAAAPVSLADATVHLSELDIDVMIPHMFCPAGMTHYRALFDLLAIPYVGNTPAVMAIGARKDLTRAIVAAAGVRVPDGEVLRDGDRPGLSPPAVVKPLAADNSAGVTLVREAAEYGPAVAAAREAGAEVLIERFIPAGREVRCGLLERDGELIALPLEEYPVNTTDRPIRTAADKLARGEDRELELVAKGGSRAWIVDRDDPITERVWSAARRCHAALGCRHYSLFDFRIDPAGEPWFLEAGLYCSFSPQSVVATMAASIGLSTAACFDVAVDCALKPARHLAEVN